MKKKTYLTPSVESIRVSITQICASNGNGTITKDNGGPQDDISGDSKAFSGTVLWDE